MGTLSKEPAIGTVARHRLGVTKTTLRAHPT